MVAKGEGVGNRWAGDLGVVDANSCRMDQQHDPTLLLFSRSVVFDYSTGNNIQYPGINHNGKEYKKGCTHTYITESLGCRVEINIAL